MKKKLKQITKRGLPLLLVGVIASTAVCMSYNKAREAKAAVVVDDILIVASILALFGIVINIPKLDNPYEGDNSIDDETAEGFANWWKNLGGKDAYSGGQKSKEWMKENGYMDENGELTDAWYDYLGQEKPSSSGGSGDGGSGDDNNDGSDLWKSIKKMFKDKSDSGMPIDMASASALGTILGLATLDFLAKSEEGKIIPEDSTLPANIASDMVNYSKEYPYVMGSFDSAYPSNGWSIFMLKEKPLVYLYDKGYLYANYPDASYCPVVHFLQLSYPNSVGFEVNEVSLSEQAFFVGSLPVGNTVDNRYAYPFHNFKVYDTYEDALANYSNEDIVYPSKINPDTVAQNTDAKNQTEPLTKPLYDNVKVPSNTDLKDYFDNMANAKTENEKQKVIDDWIASLTKPSTDPDTPVDPKPDPDNPDKPGTDIDPDNMTDEDKGKFLLPDSIKRKFPFCIPFDLIDAFTVLDSQGRTAPRIKWHFKSETFDIDYIFDIDLSMYDEQAELLRMMEVLLFIVGLVLATRTLIKG